MNDKGNEAGGKRKLLPKLRFSEFRDAVGWDVTELANLIEAVSPPKKIPTTQYSDSGAFPIIDQSQAYISGWTNDQNAVVKNGLPLIIFGDHTCILKITDKPFAQGADGIRIFRSASKVTTPFLYQQLQANPLKMEEYKRHFSILKNRKISHPDIKTGEQQKIADCLSSLDELILVLNQKLDSLRMYKIGLLQQLFPAKSTTVPKLSFPEFLGQTQWHLEELERVATFVKDRISFDQVNRSNYISTENLLPDFGGISSAVNLPQSGSIIRFQKNDILISNIRPYLKKIWIANTSGGASNDVIVIRSKLKLLPEYLSSILKREAYINYVMSGAHGVKMPRGDLSLIKKYPVSYSTKPEQEKIADFLFSLDNLIQAESQKINALKEHKKGLMQQLFPVIANENGD